MANPPHIYGLDAQGHDFVAAAAKIAQDVVAKHAGDVDQKGRFPSEAMEALAKAGFHGLTLPTALGGKGRGPRDFCAVVEELGAQCASTAMIYVMHTAASQAIAAAKSLGTKDEILREIAAGKHLTTLALTEAGSRSQFWFMTSELKEQGDASLFTSTKRFVTSSEHADSYVTESRRPGAKGPAELSMFLAHRKSQGVKVKGGYDGLGLRGNESGAVEFSGYKVSKSDLLLPHGEGNAHALGVVLPWFNIGTSAMAHGVSRAAIAATTAHLTNTGFEHDKTKLRDLPTLRARLAEMQVRLDQSRALLRYALDLIENPAPFTPLYVLQCRYAAINAAVDVTDLAMKACGGAAFAKQVGVERNFRDARAGWVMAPTSDASADFIGRALTGMELM